MCFRFDLLSRSVQLFHKKYRLIEKKRHTGYVDGRKLKVTLSINKLFMTDLSIFRWNFVDEFATTIKNVYF